MRYDQMSAFIVMDIVREAAKYPNAIHFEIGQPDLPPSDNVKAALQDAVTQNQFSYTESLGLKALREKITDYYDRTYQVNISPNRILLTPGTSGAFLVAYALTLNNGDKLGLTDPSYPCYKNFAYMMDIRLLASASSPGLSLRRTLSWESIQVLTNFSDFKTWLFGIQALIVILLIFAFCVTICNFWVQWTWHELRTLFFSQDQGQEEVEA